MNSFFDSFSTEGQSQSYNSIDPGAEVLGRSSIRDQAAFFCLLTRLKLPVLRKSANSAAGYDHSTVGSGASSSVTQEPYPLGQYPRDAIHDSLPIRSKSQAWGIHQVIKRIIPSSHDMNDSQQLAAIILS